MSADNEQVLNRFQGMFPGTRFDKLFEEPLLKVEIKRREPQRQIRAVTWELATVLENSGEMRVTREVPKAIDKLPGVATSSWYVADTKIRGIDPLHAMEAVVNGLDKRGVLFPDCGEVERKERKNDLLRELRAEIMIGPMKKRDIWGPSYDRIEDELIPAANLYDDEDDGGKKWKLSVLAQKREGKWETGFALRIVNEEPQVS